MHPAGKVVGMSGSPTTMMVSVPHLGGGLQVQHCTVSLPRIDALLDDPDTRYFVAHAPIPVLASFNRTLARERRNQKEH
jgi:hypothetical protein